MTEHIDQQFLLEWAGEISRIHPFMDFHVHPFDVLFGDIGYQADLNVKGLYVKGSSVYKPPSFERKEESLSDRYQAVSDNSRALLLASRLIYSHTGPKVFNDQLDLAGIAGALLLPVARVAGAAIKMIEVSEKIFQEENRFYLASPFPIGISPNELSSFYSTGKKSNKVCAIKIHPNLAGLDPLTRTGKELIETTLIAAGGLKLPVVVHGGYTFGLSSPEAKGYGTLDRLANINWNISSCPVIIAHAGCYGLTEGEMTTAITILNKLMEKNPYLLADTSALSLPILQLLLGKVDRNRLIFGSDALYFTVWKAWVRFLQAVRIVSPCPDDDLIRIASLNPAQCLVYSGYSPL
jgi:predicted TIM-barrel fold metal-dependent hydrolase